MADNENENTESQKNPGDVVSTGKDGGVASNAQEGVVPESKHSSEHFDAQNSGDGSEHFENKSDEQNAFPNHLVPPAQRLAGELPPDLQRVQAERRKNIGELEDRDKATKTLIAGEPGPSGEEENPHEGEKQGDIPKHSDDEPQP